MSKCIVKILRDETPGGLAEKINKELEENTRSWDTVIYLYDKSDGFPVPAFVRTN